jgi:chromosome segregation ATPase
MEAAMASLAQQSQALEAEREDWQKRIEAAEEELSDSKSALAALNEQTCEEIRALRDQLDAGAKQAGQLRIDLSETTQAFAAAREDLASKTAALDEARRAMEQQKLEWAEKYDKSHTWHLMRIAEERSLALAASEAEIARLKDALAQSRQNVTMLDGHLARSAAANADIRAELKNLREENAALKDLKRERRGHGKKPANLKIVRRS